MNFRLAFVALLISGISSCVKPPTYPDEPAIKFISVSKQNMMEGDSLLITISFTDGNGDIGAPDGTQTIDTLPFACKVPSGNSNFYYDPFKTMFILDERDSCYMSVYKAAYIEPKGKFDDISGEIAIISPPVACKKFPPQALDSVRWEIRIRDRSGNFSNPVFTPYVTINCQ